MDLADNTDSHCPFPPTISGPKSLDPRPLLPSNTEQQIIGDALATAVSQPLMPINSRTSTPVVPSPKALTASPPSAIDAWEEGSSPPRSPDHRNLGHNYPLPQIFEGGEMLLFQFRRSVICYLNWWSLRTTKVVGFGKRSEENVFAIGRILVK